MAVFMITTCAAVALAACQDDASSGTPVTTTGTALPVTSSTAAATTTTTAPASTSAAPAKTTDGAIQRMEQFLHATGKGDLKTMCVIAGPAMKQAAAEGVGSCEQAFTAMLGMISGPQKAALREATVDPAKVATHGAKVEVPAGAVRAKEKFTSSDLGDFTLEYRDADWYIVD